MRYVSVNVYKRRILLRYCLLANLYRQHNIYTIYIAYKPLIKLLYPLC